MRFALHLPSGDQTAASSPDSQKSMDSQRCGDYNRVCFSSWLAVHKNEPAMATEWGTLVQ